ncbi:MAG TPA: MsnO8 family LLM class oxidoreductase [Flavipsychrobacter sp.]|nr:MsnO8 family LLM class oxidoreductase [Flavipsychrobacter sp.]
MNKPPSTNDVLPFGVLDLCKRSEKQTTGEAIADILKLGELADQVGYTRYWVAEHHVPYAASSAPELLIPLLAARTKRIRVGTGGIIMGYYSPYRVAEIANTLQTISDGRFDLGMCRGPGVTDEAIASELVGGNLWELDKGVFTRKIAKVISLVNAADSQARIKIHTTARRPPQLWVLGSNDSSVVLANDLHTSLALALFITRDENKALVNSQRFQASAAIENYSGRKVILAVSVVCDDTDEKALMRHKKLLSEGTMPSNFIGSYKNVTGQLLKLLGRFNVDELLIVQYSRNHHERMETYGSLAENYRLLKV